MNNGEFGEVKINDHFEKVFEDALKAKEAWLDMQTATKLRFHWSAPSPGYDNHFPLYRLGRLRYFASFSLQFETIFYGYASNKVWVSLKGFISLEMDTAEKCYNYVAPLMAKWLYADYSSVNHISSNTSPTIQWRNLHLSLKDKLPFSFQLTLLNNGSIQFTYKIPSTKHNLHAQLPNTLMLNWQTEEFFTAQLKYEAIPYRGCCFECHHHQNKSSAHVQLVQRLHVLHLSLSFR
ncbi:Hypothetical predicted protein [Cloeon dipterum]|uniref:Uncharacterized protein n=1 Tax=Cloeon dipterum TaxID=197152 RepID=A0A8S1E1G5_9INSE|nr:Hypothetical predicted protein [Cloeon dipterum]